MGAGMSGLLSAIRLEEYGVCSATDFLEATEDSVKAWAYLEPDAALAQAREADRIRRAGR